MSAVTELSPRSTACSDWRETPIRRAASDTERRTCSSRISRNNSPGCVGARSIGRRTDNSVVLFEVDASGIAVLPFEGDAPRPVYVDRIALRAALRGVEVEARLAQHVERGSRVERIQPAAGAVLQIGADRGRSPGPEKRLQTTALEALDH